MTGPARRFFFAFVAASAAAARASDAAPAPHGGRVGWARLVTPNSRWGIHSDQDPKLASFIRSQTTLNIDPTWYSVAPERLDQLCNYPFIYAKDLLPISAESEFRNLGEYLQRGGFICVDPCVNAYTEQQRQTFLRRHRDFFTRLVPGCEVRDLTDRHEIFRCYFNVSVDDLITNDMIRLGVTKPDSIGMQGVFQGERVIAVISTRGLECGWPQTPMRAPGCMKMIVNAYVYAMTRGSESAPSAR